ncbi:tetratricopeptide repeat protein [Marinobacter confluentis]|uniref:Sel1 repeat family protein n=1 Tax=Marinobacter confluentis TaxID=1697557 RepID=A0A4Z1CIC6_9GAMM|nr:tetratricopeptide repeat protein [Marinobacter confluentis]TGN40582.1 sel1 repeat family protein [Marinobacter confluentis]
MNRRWLTRTAVPALALGLMLSTPVATAADNESDDQDYVTRDMIRSLNAYAVYKMGQYESAFEQYLELAEEGSRQGMVNVANMFAQGQGVEKSQEKAFQWYFRAAESGDSISMVEVARAYDQGLGTDINRHQAVHWYQKAAQAGNNDARWRLGKRLYNEGSTAEGLCLIQAAEEGGQPSAQQFLSALKQDTGLEETLSQLTCSP